MRWLFALLITVASSSALAQPCFKTSVMNPSPLMGNHGEVFRTAEGAVFEVVGSFEYLFAFFPTVTICPDRGRMLVEGRSVGIRLLQAGAPSSGPSDSRKDGEARPARPRVSQAPITVVLRVRGCDYFLADGPLGVYLLGWYGGYDPSRGDGIFGEINGFGFKDVMYANGSDGRLYVDDYMLSKDRALEKLSGKCR
jgi:hypothetical protein